MTPAKPKASAATEAQATGANAPLAAAGGALAGALRAGRPLALLDEADLGWIDAIIDVVVRHAGEPWRIALEEIDAGAWLAAGSRAHVGVSERPHVGDRNVRDDAMSERPHVGDRNVRDDAMSERPHVGDRNARDATMSEHPHVGDRNTRDHARLSERPHAGDRNARTDAMSERPVGDRNARAPAGAMPAREPTPRRINAAVAALRRLLGGRAFHASVARKARALVLGVPALDADARAARLAAAAAVLQLEARAIEQVLWADLPSERPIELLQGRPSAAEVAAHANVGLVQRSLARAHAVDLRIRGDAGPVMRVVAARGLIATTSLAADGATVFEIAGPLALCHRTSVYGRALGGLVPLLGGCDDFEMQIRAEARGQTYELVVAAPALLPALPPPRPWKLVERLARDLEKRGFTVTRTPAPIASAHGIVCPDLRVEENGGGATSGAASDRRGSSAVPVTASEKRARGVWLEIVGFWTPEFLARKVARYAAAGIRDVVLCVDGARACDDDDPPPGACVVRFERRIDAGALAQLLGRAPA